MTTNYRITGNTQAPPLYPLNSTTIPTVNNVTIASNLATATAAAGSFVTWDYEASNTVTKITPKFTMQLSGLTIDPTSATGSVKINYPNNNTLQVGSKILVTDGGVTTEQTIAGGSQATYGITTTGFIKPFVLSNNEIRIWITGSNKVGKTNTNFSYGELTTATIPSGLSNFASVVFFNNKYYVSGAGDGIYETLDFETYTKVQNAPYANCITYIVILNNNLIAFSRETTSNSQQCTVYSSNNGSTWSTVSTPTTPSAISASDDIYQFAAVGTELLISMENWVGLSTDSGVNWTFSKCGDSNNNGFCGINKFGSIYTVACYERGNTSTSAIITSNDFSSWTNQVTAIAFNSLGNIQLNSNSTKAFITRNGRTDFYTSTNGTSWIVEGNAGINQVGYFLSTNNNYFVRTTAASSLSYSIDSGDNWLSKDLSNLGYQFTITSPSLPVPDAVYLGGQTLGYSVQETTTPSWQTTTLTYEDSAGTITTTAAQYDVTGTHVVLRVQNLNSGDVVSMVGADLTIASPPPPTPTGGGIPTQIKGNRTPSNFITDYVVFGKLNS